MIHSRVSRDNDLVAGSETSGLLTFTAVAALILGIAGFIMGIFGVIAFRRPIPAECSCDFTLPNVTALLECPVGEVATGFSRPETGLLLDGACIAVPNTTDLEGQIAEMQSQVDDLSAAVATLNNTVIVLGEDVVAVNETTVTLGDDIDTQTTRITTLNSSLSIVNSDYHQLLSTDGIIAAGIDLECSFRRVNGEVTMACCGSGSDPVADTAKPWIRFETVPNEFHFGGIFGTVGSILIALMTGTESSEQHAITCPIYVENGVLWIIIPTATFGGQLSPPYQSALPLHGLPTVPVDANYTRVHILCGGGAYTIPGV